MLDQPGSTSESGPTASDELSGEISSSLSTVWARYCGSRPADASVVIDGSTIRWTVPGGKAEFESGLSATNEALEPGEPVRTLARFERETSVAVAKATRRTVRARITKQNKETGAATEAFILEAPTRKY